MLRARSRPGSLAEAWIRTVRHETVREPQLPREGRDLELVEYLRENALGDAAHDSCLERDVRAHAARCEPLLAVIVPFLPSARTDGTRPRVLEVGLGSGYVTTALRWRFGRDVDVYAVDSPARALVASPRLASYLETHDVRFEPADLVAGPLGAFGGVDFDVIVLSEVVEHLPPPDVPRALSGLVERLRPRGILVVSSPNLQSFHRRASLALGSGRIFDLPIPLDYADGTYGHLRLYGRAEVEELFAHAGLELAHWEYVNWESLFIVSSGVKGALLRAGQRLLPHALPALASGWIAVARRSGS